MLTRNILMLTCKTFYVKTCEITMFICELNYVIFYIILLHVDINETHAIIIMLHVYIIYPACRRQKYATIICYTHFSNSQWVVNLPKIQRPNVSIYIPKLNKSRGPVIFFFVYKSDFDFRWVLHLNKLESHSPKGNFVPFFVKINPVVLEKKIF